MNPIPVVLNLLNEECTAIDTANVGDISCKCNMWNVGMVGSVPMCDVGAHEV